MATENATIPETFHDVKIEIARHDERISDLEEWREDQGQVLRDINAQLKGLEKDFGKRPTWAITMVITILTSLVSGMGIYIVTNI